MGYGYYVRDGMERGYSVPDKCPAEGCGKAIDRGLAYLCYSCGKYFCDEHLTYAWMPDGDTMIEFNECFAGTGSQCCRACAEEAEKRAAEEEGAPCSS
jgi:hypothetical protein